MLPKRLSVKFYVEQPAEIALEPFMAIFQRWIQRDTVEGLLIDVVDYHHVQDGPGIVLIADEGDYSMDMSEGRPGLLYVRKRHMPDSFQAALSEVLRLAILACEAMKLEKAMNGQAFNYGEVRIAFLDRLNTANTAQNFAAYRSDLETFASTLYDGASVEIEHVQDDPRQPLTVRLVSTGQPDAASLLQRLEAVQSISS